MAPPILLLLILCAALASLARAASSDSLVAYGDLVEDLYEESSTSLHGLPQDYGDYQLTRKLYATEKSGVLFGDTAVWIGFTAVSSSKGDIAVVLRGTIHVAEWVSNLMVEEVEFQYLDGRTSDAHVHSGFFGLYTASDSSQDATRTSLRQQLVDELRSLLATGNYGSVTLVGHSLGGALAILSAFDIANSDLTATSFRMSVYTFASPMVGDGSFRQMAGNLDILRMVDIRDVVPYLPSLNYEHVGEVLSVDGCQYPSTAGVIDKIIEYHSLKRYLHTAQNLKPSSASSSSNSTSSISPEDMEDIEEFVKMIISSVKSGFSGLKNLISAMATYVSNFSKAC